MRNPYLTMNNFQATVREAAYNAMTSTNPKLMKELKKLLKRGQTAAQIEKRLTRKHGQYDLVVNSAILAAYHIQSNPDLLEEGDNDHQTTEDPCRPA